MCGPGSPVPGSPWASVDPVNNPRPHPRPGPAGPDTDELRSAFDDLLAESAGAPEAEGGGTVRDHQVRALDAAHELLSRALTDLDSSR